MEVVYRNNNLLQKEAKEKKETSQDSLARLARRIKQRYPLLYAEVGTKNVKQILKAVFNNIVKEK